MHKNVKLLTGALLGALALAHSPSANAADTKQHHGSECKVYGTTAWTDLGFGWRGIFNKTKTPKVVVCPLVKDSETRWDGDEPTPANSASVHIHYRTPPGGGSITCSVYTQYSGSLVSTKTFTEVTSGDGNYFASLPPLVSATATDSGAIMLCNIGGNTTLQHYVLNETSTTSS